MPDPPIKLLFVDDDKVDQMAFARMVTARALPYDVDMADSVAQARERLQGGRYDLVVADYHLGDGVAFDLFDLTTRTPVIVATGMGDEATAVQALKRGAYDYVVKDAHQNYLVILPMTIDRALAHHHSIVEREAARVEVQRSRDDMLSILNLLRLGVAMTDQDGHLTFLSKACQEILGPAPGDGPGRHWEEVCPFSEADKVRIKHCASLPLQDREKVAVRLRTRQGRRFAMEVEIQDDPRDPRRKIFLLYDMTAVEDLRRLLARQVSFEGMVGKSEIMHVVFEQIRELAKLDSTVLIEGQTGTGKELAARAIHQLGQRKNRPFIPLNCAGLTESLLASQLFGHRRGSFTGAVDDQPGVFETAHGGTLFLDEIGDIAHSVQTSLLRVLQEREIVRLGESRPRKVDVRIIAATHRDLNEEVRDGRFRSDLLYRIRVARVMLPPLRQRRNDIPLLAQSFLSHFRASSGKPVVDISPQAMGLLMDYAWPGNVRELASAIEFAAIRCRGTTIQSEDLPPEVLAEQGTPPGESGDERSRFMAALQQASGNRTEAARLLGISRATFYRRLQELKIET